MPVHVFNYSSSAKNPYIGEHPSIAPDKNMMIKENVSKEVERVADLFKQSVNNPSRDLKKAVLSLKFHLAETMSGTLPHNIDNENTLHYHSSVSRSTTYDVKPLLQEADRSDIGLEVDLQAIDSKDQNLKAVETGVIPIALVTISNGDQKEEYVACALRGKKILILTDKLKNS
jgi:hypothetical protein